MDRNSNYFGLNDSEFVSIDEDDFIVYDPHPEPDDDGDTMSTDVYTEGGALPSHNYDFMNANAVGGMQQQVPIQPECIKIEPAEDVEDTATNTVSESEKQRCVASPQGIREGNAEKIRKLMNQMARYAQREQHYRKLNQIAEAQWKQLHEEVQEMKRNKNKDRDPLSG